jgi:hypothetical protein
MYREKYLTTDGVLEEAYVAGFKRAIELTEEILKRQGESDDNYDEEDVEQNIYNLNRGKGIYIDISVYRYMNHHHHHHRRS